MVVALVVVAVAVVLANECMCRVLTYEVFNKSKKF